MLISQRQEATLWDLPNLVEQHKVLGCLFAFVTNEDAHSPVMMSVYDDFVSYLEDQVPLYLVDAKLPVNEDNLKDLLVFSVPTLLWIRPYPKIPYEWGMKVGEELEVLCRVVGITTLKKLEHEADKILEAII